MSLAGSRPLTGNVVQGNFIGTNAAGDAPVPNGFFGLIVASPTSGTLIGGTVAGAGNVISGNAFGGLNMGGVGVNNNLVQGNFIGTNAAGTAPIPNAGDGVIINNGAKAN